MKNSLLTLIAIIMSLPAYAQSTLYTNSSSVGIGTSSPTAGAALDMSYNTNSMLLPVGTTGQRPTGVAGMLRYNSTNGVPELYTSSWLPVPLTASSPIVINSSTGNLTCPTCNTSSANVASVSGDGTLINNSASTGAVTLTLGNAPAYSVWGNNTSSSATPAYTNSPELSGAITDLQSIGATSTDGLVLTDTTAATSGNQQWSPRVRWTGQGWKTNATAASQEVDAIAEIQPVQGAANPTFNWVLSGQINGGGYGPLLTVPSGGGLNLNSGVYEINGTQLAASNLLNGVNGSGSIVLTISPILTTPNIGAATGTSLAVSGNITTSGGQVGIGTATPTTGTALDLGSNTNSMLLPVGTTGQRPTGVPGMLRYNSDGTGSIEAYYNSAWNTLASSSSGGFQSITVQTFTSSGTYTPNAHLVSAFVRIVGGGGGGGGASSVSGLAGCGSGGGAGAYAEGIFSAASIGSSQTVTIGAGGSAGSAGSDGGSGSQTSLGSLISADGGSGGLGGGASTGYSKQGGAGSSTSSGASFTSTGGSGGNGTCQAYNSSFNSGGSGGVSAFGGGGAGGSSSNGSNGAAYGSGAGGAGADPIGQSNSGGTGAAGVVVVTEYNSQ